MYLVDANILSEAMRPDPSSQVIEWLRQNQSQVVVDPIVLGEIRYGIFLLPAGSRRRRLEHWFLQGVQKIQCIPFDAKTGTRWAQLLAELRRAGESMPIKDSLVAATALTHDLTVATRNVRDFRKARVRLVNPFDES